MRLTIIFTLLFAFAISTDDDLIVIEDVKEDEPKIRQTK